MQRTIIFFIFFLFFQLLLYLILIYSHGSNPQYVELKSLYLILLNNLNPDLIEFLQLKKNNGVESERARDLFYGLWISDLFMQRVENGQMWSFFCPNIAKKLQDAVGEDYKTLYYAMLHYAMLCHTILYYTILYYTILWQPLRST